MPLVTIINPSPRKSGSTTRRAAASKGKAKMATRKKTRTAAQKRATAKMIAANRARARAARVPAQRKAVAAPARRKAKRRAARAANAAGFQIPYGFGGAMVCPVA